MLHVVLLIGNIFLDEYFKENPIGFSERKMSLLDDSGVLKSVKDASAEERAKKLENGNSVCKVHDTVARQGQTAARIITLSPTPLWSHNQRCFCRMLPSNARLT